MIEPVRVAGNTVIPARVQTKGRRGRSSPLPMTTTRQSFPSSHTPQLSTIRINTTLLVRDSISANRIKPITHPL
jgi:hypothetical protein